MCFSFFKSSLKLSFKYKDYLQSTNIYSTLTKSFILIYIKFSMLVNTK